MTSDLFQAIEARTMPQLLMQQRIAVVAEIRYGGTYRRGHSSVWPPLLLPAPEPRRRAGRRWRGLTQAIVQAKIG